MTVERPNPSGPSGGGPAWLPFTVLLIPGMVILMALDEATGRSGRFDAIGFVVLDYLVVVIFVVVAAVNGAGFVSRRRRARQR